MQDSRAEPVSVVVEYLYLQLYEPKEPFPMNFTLESGGRNVFELSFPKEARLTNLDDVRFLIEMECANGSTKIGSSLVYVYSPQFTSSSSIDGQLLYLSVSHGIEGRTMQFRVTEMIRNGRNILRAAVSVDVPYGSNVPLNDLVDSLVDRVDGEVTLAYEYRLEPNRSWQKSTTSISL